MAIFSNRRTRLVAASIIASSALIASLMASFLRPTEYLSEKRHGPNISESIPNSFGDWTELNDARGVVNPQARELIDRLYVETVSRTYTDSDGYRVMLAVAYGQDQRDSLQVHRPEVCYPAQGFQVNAKRSDQVDLAGGNIPVTVLITQFGANRNEPVVYWTTVGDRVVKGAVDKKIAEISYAINGLIPDGLLFRVSSIDSNKDRAFLKQKAFIRALVDSLTPALRLRITGLKERERAPVDASEQAG